mmetsp:Transcript_1372/g.2502  ORF Transcript_1372/g.2502 Transcript_1372/m.2502 type:complete len:93 (-) Transcript_1372:153-431(-)
MRSFPLADTRGKMRLMIKPVADITVKNRKKRRVILRGKSQALLLLSWRACIGSRGEAAGCLRSSVGDGIVWVVLWYCTLLKRRYNGRRLESS